MFQNIAADYLDEQPVKKTKKNIFKNLFGIENIILYIISFAISMVSIGDFAPFGIAFLVAALSNGVPIGILYIVTLIGTMISFGAKMVLEYIFITIVFILLMLIKKPKMQDKANEQVKVGPYLIISCLIVKFALLFTSNLILIYDVLGILIFTIITYVFYKIFANSILAIKDFKYKETFSIEEVIGATLILAISVLALGDVSILGFSVRNILCILIILILGWKNGVLVGSVGGITIGVVLGIIGNQEPIVVASYALSGMIAGVFSKFGKIGVLIGFVIGNVVLTYVHNGNTSTLILFREILIAFLGLLAIPKSMKIDIKDAYEAPKSLPRVSRKAMNAKTAYKLGAMSETISEIAKSYKEAAASVVDEEDLRKQEEENKLIFAKEFMNNLEGIEDNALFDDLYGLDNVIVDDIYKKLLVKEKINKKDLSEIFRKYNNYIEGFEEEFGEINSIDEDIAEMLKVINDTYKVSKINFIWKKKLDENKKIVSTQLEEVSKAISTMAEDINQKQDNIYEKYEKQIISLLEQKEINIKDIEINKEENGKYIIKVYSDSCKEVEEEKCHLKNIQKTLEKVLKEKLILQKHICGKEKQLDTCVYIFSSMDKFNMQIGVAKSKKVTSLISGDSNCQTKLADGKYLLAISDGMGSGEEANQSSQLTINMLQRLLSSGFKADSSIKLINSTLNLNSKDDMYATLDVGIVDLYLGTYEFIKNGACPTFIKNKKEVQLLKSIDLPAGIVSDLELAVYERELNDGDLLVLCSDGILDSTKEYTNKELWLQYLLEEITTEDAQKVADIILSEARDNDFGIEKDDMTVIVMKINKID